MTDLAPASRKPRLAVVVLGVLVVLLAGASVFAIVLYAGARDDHGLQAQRLDQTSRNLTGAQNRLADTKAENDAVAGRITTLESENAELHKCADPAAASIIALKADDDAALDIAVDLVQIRC